MERILQLLENIANLSAEELAELDGLIQAEFDAIPTEGVTADSVAALEQLVGAAEAVKGETGNRAAAQAEAEQKVTDLRSRMEAVRAKDAPADPDAEAEAKAAAEAEAKAAEAKEAPAADATPAPEESGDAALPIAASGAPRGAIPEGMISRMAQQNGRAVRSPEVREVAPNRPLVAAAAGLRHLARGEIIEDRKSLSEAMADTLTSLYRVPQGQGKVLVASARWSYPEDRQLGDNINENTRRIDAVCGFDAERAKTKMSGGALVATGGICLPVNVDYSVPTWSSADRPLRDGLPAFEASRGGVMFVTPPDIGTSPLQGAAAGAGLSTGVWSEATDANPAGATKPVWVVPCGAEQTVYVNALPTRVQFGNMQSRFAPEQVAANTQQAIVATARNAELELLVQMYAASKQVVPGQYLGATRDVLATIDLLSAQYRYSHRIPKSAAMTAVFPDWAKDVIRADLARELAHDNTNGRDVLGISDAQIEDWLSMRGVNAIWTLDALSAGTYGTGGHAIPNQFFPVLTGGNTAPQWPGQTANGAFTLAWLLYVEGSFQFLDGGRLDLGVVRDSVLDATNDYETFVETFEGIAFRGIDVYQVQSTILPTGGSAGTIAPGSYAE